MGWVRAVTVIEIAPERTPCARGQCRRAWLAWDAPFHGEAPAPVSPPWVSLIGDNYRMPDEPACGIWRFP